MSVRPALSRRARATLAAALDTIVPAASGLPALQESASDLGVPERAEEALRQVLPEAAARDLRRLLAIMDDRIANIALVGRPVRFSRLSAKEREDYVLRLVGSRVAQKRAAGVGLRRLASYLYYTDPRTWPAIGYPGPPPASPSPDAVPGLPSWDGHDVDVVVVGSGAGGGVAAGVLAAAGQRVLVVESSPARAATELGREEATGTRDLYDGAGALTSRDGAITILAGRAPGGGTTVNWMTSLAPRPWLRAEWESLGVDGAAGPGFESHVQAVLSRAHVGTAESTLNGPNQVLADGASRLGWSWSLLPRNARGCRDRCGFCVFGCPWGAKQGTLVTWLSDAAGSGARFLLGHSVREVLVERGKAKGVRLDDGRDVRARAVVLCGGALRTAALLLRSGVRHRGLGRLFLHPATSVVGTYRRRAPMWEGAMQTVVVDRFADLDGNNHGVLFEAVPAHPGLSAASLPWRGGIAAKEDMLRLGHTVALLVLLREDGAGRVQVDRHGEPIVRYGLSRGDADRLSRGMQELVRIHQAAGAIGVSTLHAAGIRAGPFSGPQGMPAAAVEGVIDAVGRADARPAHAVGLFSAHQMGTCGLGRDGEAPADGASGRVWDVEGLYVMDGSAFPTPSGVNPMITIQALAHRNATRLARALGGSGPRGA